VKKSKHLSYYDFLDALKEDGCPICRLVKAGIENYYDSLIYEYINDPGFRDNFRKDKGFCEFHADKFVSYNDGLAVALPYRDLLNDILKDLNHNKNHKKDENNRCMICVREKDLENAYLSILIDYIEDPEFVQAFSESDGLCIPHYKMAVSMMKNPPRWFIDFHTQKYQDLLRDLDRYIDSCNYSLGDRRPILTKREKLIWRKVVKYINKER
jgi:hypothetical protein